MEIRKFLGLPVSRRVTMALIIILPLVGFLVGYIGHFGRGATTLSITPTITPRDIGLAAGQSRPFTVIIKNSTDQGARVASISTGSSEDAGAGCPAGSLTSAKVTNPSGFIRASGVNGYVITLSLAGNVDERCLSQPLALPLTVELQGN